MGMVFNTILAKSSYMAILSIEWSSDSRDEYYAVNALEQQAGLVRTC
jgi:hypothetical protein